MLTRKQMELLDFIQKRLDRDGVPPSFDEMKDALELRSKSGIHRLITALEERGFIRRLAHRARAIEVVKLPETLERNRRAAERGGDAAGFTPRVIEGRKETSSDTARTAGTDRAPSRKTGSAGEAPGALALELPVMGRIAAGVPIEAISEVSHTIGVPHSMLSGQGQHFALEVRGESMTGLGINDGDIVVIREQGTADNGDIVVALVEGHEATLKTFRRRGGMIALEAANPDFETRLLPEGAVKVQGRLVGLIRTY